MVKKRLTDNLTDSLNDLSSLSQNERKHFSEITQRDFYEIMQEEELLKDRILVIPFRSTKISEEILLEHRRIMQVLLQKLNKCDVRNTIDIRECDRELYKLCDELEEAYETGDLLSAVYIMQIYVYGILIFHKEISDKEMISVDFIMAKRERNFREYLKLLPCLQKCFQLEQNIKRLYLDMRKTMEKMQRIAEEFDMYRDMLFNAIERIVGLHAPLEDVDDDAYRIVLKHAIGMPGGLPGVPPVVIDMLKEAEYLENECKTLKQRMALDCGECVETLEICKQIQIRLENEVREYFLQYVEKENTGKESELGSSEMFSEILTALYGMDRLEEKKNQVLAYQEMCGMQWYEKNMRMY